MTDATTPAGPTTAQLVMAFADALAPLAGPAGIVADDVMHAGLTFLSNLQAQREAGQSAYTMENLEIAAAKATDHLAQLKADVEAQ